MSPLFKYRIRGPDAERFLDRLITRNVARCAVGQVLYTPWCDGEGKVIDDGTLARLAENDFRLTAADPSLLWFHDNAAGMDVSVEDVTDTVAALALQGPTSRRILQELTSADLEALRFFRVMRRSRNRSASGPRMRYLNSGETSISPAALRIAQYSRSWYRS